MNRVLLPLVVCSVVGSSAPAQEPAYPIPTWSIAPYLGLARNSPQGTHWGWATQRDHVLIGAHLDAHVWRMGPLTLLYAPNVTALVRVSHSPPESGEPRQPTATGVGIAPLGIGLRLKLRTPLTAQGRLAVGGVWLNHTIPTPDGREFNFSLETGGSLAWRVRPRTAIELGYKFYHLSNLYSRPNNDGVDADLFYVGWRREVGR